MVRRWRPGTLDDMDLFSTRADPRRARRGPLARPRGAATPARASPRSRSRRPAKTSTRCSPRSSAEQPDVVVTDIRMPPSGTDEGIHAAERLRETHPDVGVVVLSQYAEPSYALALLEGGSGGGAYLLKERVERSRAARGRDPRGRGRRLGDRPEGRRGARRGERPQRDSPLNELTPRERDVLREMAEGRNNAAIAGRSVADRAVGREGHPLDLPQARAHLGDGRPPARQGGDAVPRREPLGIAASGSEARERVRPPGNVSSARRPPRASTRSRSRPGRPGSAPRDDLEDEGVRHPRSR